MFGKLVKYFRHYTFYAVLCPILMMIEVGTDVIIPRLMGYAINEGVLLQNVDVVWKYGLQMTMYALIGLVCGSLSSYLGAKAGQGFGANLRLDLYAKIQTLSFSNIDHFSVPSLITRLTNDIERLARLAQMSLRIAIRAPFMFLMALLMAIQIDLQLSIIFAIAIPLMGIVIGVVSSKAGPRFRALQKQLDKLNARVQENLGGIRVVKSFVREQHEIELFDEENDALLKKSLEAIYIIIMLMPIMMAIVFACTAAVLWFGGNRLLLGQIQAGDLFSYLMYIGQVLHSVVMVSMVIFNFSRGKASAERIFAVLETESDITSPAHPIEELKDGSIEFRNVRFRYEGNPEDSIKNVSLRIESGETVALIGSTGSAKTTLIQLIPRLYDADAGEVLVGGENVKRYDLVKLRDQVALVLQNNTLFSGSIRDNMHWGDPDADDETILGALETAQIGSLIDEREAGLDSLVEQGGSNFSGGQKQRVSIARSLLKKPRILILDDSTSAVDMATDNRLVQALAEERPGMTRIVIAQRIASVMGADRIVVLEDGEINGIGTHDELLQNNAIYREIYESQQRGVIA